MRQDHAVHVKNQLQDASKRSKELQTSLPDFSDAVDPFSEIPLMDERNATAQVKNQVGSQCLNSSLYADGMKILTDYYNQCKH